MSYRICKYLLFLILIGCSHQPNINSLADINNRIKPPLQTFEIDPTKENLLTCSGGSLVYLPANSLVFNNKSFPRGLIKITIAEVKTIASMIGNNISTVSNDSILETNGMLEITAMSGADKLKIHKDKSLVVMFPSQNKTDFKLFYGTRDNSNKLNWSLDKIDNIKPDSLLDNIPIGDDTSLIKKVVTMTGGLYSESQGNLDYYITWKVNNKDSSLSNHIEHAFAKEKTLYDYFIKNDSHLKLEIFLDSKGKIKLVNFEDSVRYKKEISNLLMQIPSFDLNSMKKSDMTESYTLYIGVLSKLDKDRYLQKFNLKYKTYRDKAIQKVDNAELNYFIYSITSLGWINCDRFPNMGGENGDFIVTTKATNESKVYLVFEDIKCIIEATKRGDTFVTSNVPEGQNLKIIAISYENQKPFVAIEKIKVSKKRKINISNYKEFTLDNLKQELN